MSVPCSFESSDPPQLDVAVPLCVHCPFTPGIGRVTLQGDVTLHPLNDATACYPKNMGAYFMSEIHIFPNVFFRVGLNIVIVGGRMCSVTCCVTGQINFHKNMKNKSFQPTTSTTTIRNIVLVFTLLVSALKIQNKILQI